MLGLIIRKMRLFVFVMLIVKESAGDILIDVVHLEPDCI